MLAASARPAKPYLDRVGPSHANSHVGFRKQAPRLWWTQSLAVCATSGHQQTRYHPSLPIVDPIREIPRVSPPSPRSSFPADTQQSQDGSRFVECPVCSKTIPGRCLLRPRHSRADISETIAHGLPQTHLLPLTSPACPRLSPHILLNTAAHGPSFTPLLLDLTHTTPPDTPPTPPLLSRSRPHQRPPRRSPCAATGAPHRRRVPPRGGPGCRRWRIASGIRQP